MSVKVLFFGVLSEVMRAADHVVTDNVVDTQELFTYMATLQPALLNYKFKIAVNKQLINGDVKLNDGDEIAFLPPFSGG